MTTAFSHGNPHLAQQQVPPGPDRKRRRRQARRILAAAYASIMNAGTLRVTKSPHRQP
jgi:hypothetical protein